MGTSDNSDIGVLTPHFSATREIFAILDLSSAISEFYPIPNYYHLCDLKQYT